MADIPAALVKQLRDMTGAGMMDAKRALVETGGDIEAAQKLLREKGLGQAAKRAGRETTEGKVGYTLSGDAKQGTIVALGCETDFVANSDDFQAFAEKALKLVDAEGVDALAQLGEPRGRARGRRRGRARDLRELGRGQLQARAGAREDRRRHAEQALLRRPGADRAALDPRHR
jgi:elongation factor Ts